MFVVEKKPNIELDVHRRNSRVISNHHIGFLTKNSALVMVFRPMTRDESVINPHFVKSGLKVGAVE